MGGAAAPWAPQPQIPLIYSGAAATFGRALAFSSSMLELFVGAPGGDAGGYYVFSFLRPNATAEWLPGDTYTCPTADCTSGSQFGASLALSADGSIMAVGAPRSGAYGAVYVFSRRANSTALFTHTATLASPDHTEFASFGARIAMTPAMTGGVLIVSAPGGIYGRQGSVHIFSASSGGRKWTHRTAIGNPTDANLCSFGGSLALAPDARILAIGAPGEGVARLYALSAGGGSATLLAKLTGAGGLFGGALALSAAADGILSVAIGAPGNPSYFQNGTVTVFSNVTLGRFYPVAAIALGENANDAFGAALAYDSDGAALIVGAPGANGGAGAVLVYPTDTWAAAQTLQPAAAVKFAADFGAALALWRNASDSSAPVALALGAPSSGSYRGAVETYVRSAGKFGK